MSVSQTEIKTFKNDSTISRQPDTAQICFKFLQPNYGSLNDMLKYASKNDKIYFYDYYIRLQSYISKTNDKG